MSNIAGYILLIFLTWHHWHFHSFIGRVYRGTLGIQCQGTPFPLRYFYTPLYPHPMAFVLTRLLLYATIGISLFHSKNECWTHVLFESLCLKRTITLGKNRLRNLPKCKKMFFISIGTGKIKIPYMGSLFLFIYISIFKSY